MHCYHIVILSSPVLESGQYYNSLMVENYKVLGYLAGKSKRSYSSIAQAVDIAQDGNSNCCVMLVN